MCRKLLGMFLIALMILSCSSLKPSNSIKNDPPDAPSNPFPADEAINQEISVSLAWSWNDVDGDTLSFDVYFGTLASPPQVDSNRAGAWYSPESLEYNHTYYWKIVADDGHGNQTSGPTWRFTTRAIRSFNVLGQYTNFAQGPYYDITGNIQSNYLFVTNRHSSGARDSSLILDIANMNGAGVVGYIRGALFGNQFGPGYIYSIGRLDSGFKLRAYSLGDPTNPNEEFRFDVTNIRDLAVSNEYVYLYVNGYSLGQPCGVITVHNMAIVDTLNTYSTNDRGRLRVFGNLLLLPEITVLKIIDINNPAAPQILATRSASDECLDAAISGSTMYVTLHNDGFEIVDITNLPSVSPLGSIVSINNSTDIVMVYQAVLYVADNNLLIAYSIANPASPYEIARYEAPARITSINYIQALLITYTDSVSVSGIQGLQMQP